MLSFYCSCQESDNPTKKQNELIKYSIMIKIKKMKTIKIKKIKKSTIKTKKSLVEHKTITDFNCFTHKKSVSASEV